MIDLHAHVLPGIDDGPRDLPRAVDLARAAAAAGTVQLATTPHVDHGYGVVPEDLAGQRADVQRELDAAGVGLRLLQGGEVALARLPDLDVAQLGLLTLGGGGTILLEPPSTIAGPLLERAVFGLQRRGFGVLLAHPERSPDCARDVDAVGRLVDRGVRLQVTAASLSGGFGRTARDLAVELLRRGAVHVIASDGHDPGGRPPEIASHVRAAARVLPEVAEGLAYWTELAPRAIVEGAALPPPPVVRPRARGLRRLLPRRR